MSNSDFNLVDALETLIIDKLENELLTIKDRSGKKLKEIRKIEALRIPTQLSEEEIKSGNEFTINVSGTIHYIIENDGAKKIKGFNCVGMKIEYQKNKFIVKTIGAFAPNNNPYS